MSSRTIRAYFEANRRMMAETREIPIAIVLTFLGAAIWEDAKDSDGSPMTLEDLAVRVGMTPTTVSQHLRYLGERYRAGKPGLGLVDTAENRDNRRKKVFFLTPRGRGLVSQLELIFRKAP